ncbi:MAG: hypothetical protein K2G60_03450 [Oscillospiraceae bacterium]|nr:hypothetical protein [Oscillospiraceae bacterium]
MKKSKLKAVIAVLLAFILIGAVFIGIGAGIIIKDKKYTETAESTIAIVSSIQLSNGSRQYILWYNVDGENYHPEYEYKEDDYIGKDIKIYFTKGAPEKIFIETEKVYYTLLYIGIVLAAVSAALLGALWIPVKIRAYIIKNGKTELVRIEKIVDVIGGRKILCESKKIRGKNAPSFKSKTLKRKLPKEIINTAVTVYYLPKHKNFYYIDTKTIKMRDGAK